MKNVAIVGCGAYMKSGYSCPGEWRCLKTASQSEGCFGEFAAVVSFGTGECPGRTVAPNLGMAAKLSAIKPNTIYFSSCLANAKPECPYFKSEDHAKIVENKAGIKVILDTQPSVAVLNNLRIQRKDQ